MSFGDFGRNIGLLVSRLALAAVFLYTGYRDIGHIDETALLLIQKGYPMGKVLAIVAALAEIGGGLSLALGMFTTIGCTALILFLVPTTVSFHLPGALARDPVQLQQALKNLAILGGLLAILTAGPGGWSIDRRIFTGRVEGEEPMA
jgi:putative oxidoreductase